MLEPKRPPQIPEQQLENLRALNDVAFPELIEAEKQGLVGWDNWAAVASCGTYRCAFGQYLMSCENLYETGPIAIRADAELYGNSRPFFKEENWRSPTFGITNLQWVSIFGTAAQTDATIEERQRVVSRIIKERTLRTREYEKRELE